MLKNNLLLSKLRAKWFRTKNSEGSEPEKSWKPLHQLKVGDRIAITDSVIAKGDTLTGDLGFGITPGVKPACAGREVPTPGVELSEPELAFDEIVSIKSLGKQPVMDIEIENTHNFVAGHYINTKTNQALTQEQEQDWVMRQRLPRGMSPSDILYGGIIAHNTVVTGNVGIGTTKPNYKLEVASTPAGNGSIVADYFLDLSNTSYGIDPNGTDNAYLGIGYSLKITGGALLAVGSGNVGIGTASPGTQTKLHVYEGSDASSWNGRGVFSGLSNAAIIGTYGGQATVGAHNAALTAWADLYLNQVVGQTQGMVIKTSGNVGIGTAGPEFKLHVVSTNSAGIRLDASDSSTIAFNDDSALRIRNTSNTTNNWSEITFDVSGGQVGAAIASQHTNHSSYYSNLNFYTRGSTGWGNRMTIADSGNVGIGTTSPIVKLHIEDGDVRIKQTSTHGQLRLLTGGTTAQALFYIGHDESTSVKTQSNTYLGQFGFVAVGSDVAGFSTSTVVGKVITGNTTRSLTTGELSFWTKPSGVNDPLQRLTIDNTGNVGIGTTAPLSKLSVGGVGSTDYAIYGTGASRGVYGGGTNIGVYGTSTNSLGYGVSGFNSNFVGVKGEGENGVYASGTDIGVYSTGTNYDFYAAGAGTDYGTSSSIRWKTDLQPIDNALNKVLSMRGLYYTWDEAHGGQRDMGMIAEEVGQYVPEIVGWDSDAPGYASGMDYGHLTPVLVEAIKELNQKVETLSQDLVANLTTGIIKTQTLIADQITTQSLKVRNLELTDSFTLQGQSLQAYITGVVEEILLGYEPNKILSPIAEIDHLTVEKLIATEVTTTDLTTDSITANKINSPAIDSILTKLEDLTQQYADQTATASATPILEDSEASYAALLELLQTAEDSEPWLATDSAHIAVDTLDAKFGFFQDYLAVMGTAIITNLNVTNTFSTNSISSLDNQLLIQPSGVGAINFLAGLMIMDSTGQVIINGNLTVTGQFLANKISAPTANFTDLMAQKLEVDEANIKKLTTDSLIIASDASASAQIATTSASIKTNATAGKATLPKGLTEFTVNTPHVDDNTLAYVTPIGDPDNQVLYVKSKKTCSSLTSEVKSLNTSEVEVCQPYFTIAINKALPHDLEFNWWIIKLEGEKEI